jgi:hypothetical protein
MRGVIGAVMIAGLLWASAAGAQMMTMDEAKKEMANVPMVPRTWLVMEPPFFINGTTMYPMADVCVAGDKIRPVDLGKANVNLGTARSVNVAVIKRFVSEVGDHQFAYNRQVSLPACK